MEINHPVVSDQASAERPDSDQVVQDHSSVDRLDAEHGIPPGRSGLEDSAVPPTENLLSLSLLMSMDDVSNFLMDLTRAAAQAVGPSCFVCDHRTSRPSALDRRLE